MKRPDRPLPLLLGHRGAPRSAPENSFKSFDIALRHGCDGLEFDVQCTADGEGLICHDSEYQEQVIAKTRLQDFAGAITISEVIARYSTRAFLDIELKSTGLAQAVMKALASHPPKHGYIVSSFLPEVLEEVYESDPHVRLGLLCKNKRQLKSWRKIPCCAVIAHARLVDQLLRNETREAGKQLFVWTVNRADKIRHFEALGVDGIISDYPRLLVETVRSKID